MKVRLTITATLVTLAWVAPANASLITSPKCETLNCILASQSKNLAHAKYVCNNGAKQAKRWSCRAVRWLSREIGETRRALLPDWAAIQIRYATMIAEASGGDPWPNCPDPYDGSGSWHDTVRCENGGNWLDSPGYYRCGLQFDPGWEYKYKRKFCP